MSLFLELLPYFLIGAGAGGIICIICLAKKE
jgi:hypothetical protein